MDTNTHHIEHSLYQIKIISHKPRQLWHLLTLLKSLNGGNISAAYQGVFGFQIFCFLMAGLLMNGLDVEHFRERIKVGMNSFDLITMD